MKKDWENCDPPCSKCKFCVPIEPSFDSKDCYHFCCSECVELIGDKELNEPMRCQSFEMRRGPELKVPIGSADKLFDEVVAILKKDKVTKKDIAVIAVAEKIVEKSASAQLLQLQFDFGDAK